MASLRSVHKTKEFLRQINVHQRPFSSSAAVFLPGDNDLSVAIKFILI